MSIYETSEGLSGIAGVTHGFFGRAGGQSTGEFADNNVSLAVGDDPVAVLANRAGVARMMGFDPAQLCILKQVHSNHAETVTTPVGDRMIEADAMVTATPGLLLGILTADCTPILFADPEAGVIGAAHAGWRGAVDGVVEHTVEAMTAVGARRENIICAYGPTIYGENYEVGEQFMADVLALHPDAAPHFHTPPGGAPHFDLPGFVEEQVRRAGIERVERVGASTYANPGRYFSHRRATHQGTRTGRQIAVIGLTQV